MSIKSVNSGAAANGLKKALALKAKTQTDPFFNKDRELNAIYHVFFPVFIDEDGDPTIGAASCTGRQLDYTALGYSYVKIQAEYNEIGRPIDTSGLQSLANIARVLLECEANKAKVNAERAAKAEAEDLHIPLDTAKLKKTIDDIDMEYFGGTVNDQKILPKHNPVIRGSEVTIVTNCYRVKLNPDGSPAKDEPFRCSLPLSGNRAKELGRIAAELTEADIARGYIACLYEFAGADKNEAGRKAKFVKLKDSEYLEVTYPSWWQSKGKTITENLDSNADVIMNRDKSISNTPSVRDVFAAFKAYAANQATNMYYITDWSSRAVETAAKDLLDFEVLIVSDEMRAKLEEIAATQRVENNSADEEAEAKRFADQVAIGTAGDGVTAAVNAVDEEAFLSAMPDVAIGDESGIGEL